MSISISRYVALASDLLLPLWCDAWAHARQCAGVCAPASVLKVSVEYDGKGGMEGGGG